MSTVVSHAGVPGRGAESALWLGLGIVALGCLVWLFGPSLLDVATNWSDRPEYSHGWLIPLVTAVFLWQRRGGIAAERTAGSWAGAALVALGLVLLILFTASFARLPAAAMFLLVLAGLGLASLGWGGMRLVWVPLCFLLFALPVPNTAYYLLATKLQLLSSWLGAGLLQAAGVSVFLDGNVIDLGTMQLQVAEACSGLRYLFPLAAFGFLCAWLYRAPLWARVLVVLATVPITIGMNSLRIALTGLLVEYGDPELAEGFMHLFEGWVIFLGALALLFGLMWLLARLTGAPHRPGDLLDFDRIPGQRREGARNAAVAGSLLPFAVCVGLLALAIPANAWVLGREHVIPARPGLLTFPLTLGDWQGRAASPDEASLQMLDLDDYLLADFTRAGTREPVNFWVAYYGRTDNRSRFIHTPEACLPGSGWEFTDLQTITAPVAGLDGEPFQIKRATVGKGNERLLVYYWFEQRGHQFTNEMWSKIYNLTDSITLGRSDGALVRIITPLAPGEPAGAADERLADFMRLAYPELEKHVGR